METRVLLQLYQLCVEILRKNIDENEPTKRKKKSGESQMETKEMFKLYATGNLILHCTDSDVTLKMRARPSEKDAEKLIAKIGELVTTNKEKMLMSLYNDMIRGLERRVVVSSCCRKTKK